MAWGKLEFEEQISKLNKMITNEIDLKRKTYLLKVLDTTNKLYRDIFVPFSQPKESSKQRLVSISDTRLSYSRYYSIVSSFFKEVNHYLENINHISSMLEEIDPDGNFDFLETGVDFSESHVLSLVNIFYKNFDQDLYSYFSEAYSDRENSVNFLELENDDGKTDGTTCFIDGVRKNYISLYKTNFISTYQCAIHEYGHVIANLINPQTSYSDREDFFVEVAAIFPELVSLYEKYISENDLQALYCLYTTLVTYIDYAECLCLHSPVLNAWADSNFKMNTTFFNSLKEDYDIDGDYFESLLSTTLEDEGVYVLSYIVSLELLHLYKNDKKASLNLFKKLLNFPANEDILSFIMENFSLNANVSEETNQILESFNRELKLRRC